MLSDVPEYNDKISVAHAMTPTVILKHNHPLILRNMGTINYVAVNFFFLKLFANTIDCVLEFFVCKLFWLKILCASQQTWLRNNGMIEVFSHGNDSMDLLTGVSKFCMQPRGREICRSVVYILFGPSNFYFDELLQSITNHIPAGASYKQFVHYAQIAATRKFKLILFNQGRSFFLRTDSIGRKVSTRVELS